MAKSHLNLVCFLICSFIANKPFEIYSFSIKLIPIDRFDKILFPENLILKERYQRIYNISIARMYQLELSITSLSTMDHKEPAKRSRNALKPPISRHPAIGYYMTKVMVGTPSQIPYLVVDTASEDTWTQCEG